MHIKESVNNFFSKLEGWKKKALIIMGIITITQFFSPYIQWTFNYFVNSYKVQRDYQDMSKRLDNLEDYVEVVNYIIDGVSETRYHRGIRYLITKGSEERPPAYLTYNEEKKMRWDLSHCDWYYLVKDSDGIKKWLRANYSAEYDSFTYIDHDGHHHDIAPSKPSKIIKNY